MKIGSEVKDKITGFVGIITARTEFLSGTVRLGVQGVQLKDGLPTEVQWYDEGQLEVFNSNIEQVGGTIIEHGAVINPGPNA